MQNYDLARCRGALQILVRETAIDGKDNNQGQDENNCRDEEDR